MSIEIPIPLSMLTSYLVTSLIIAAVIIVVFQLLGRRTEFKSRRRLSARTSGQLSLLVVAASLLGVAVGFTGGWSRVGVVGDIVPAALTLLGGFTVYLFGSNKGKAVVAGVCTITFTLAFFVGYLVGAETRNPSERVLAFRDFCHESLSNPDLLKDDDAYCRFFDSAGERCMWLLFHDAATYNVLRKSSASEKDRAWKSVNKEFLDKKDFECQLRLSRKLATPTANR